VAQAAAVSVEVQPDITIQLDLEGVIREVTLSDALPEPVPEDWIGRPWVETVVDPGSAKVERIVSDARSRGVSAFRQINQRFPSGLELPIEYTAVRLGRHGLLAVGKSLQAVAELHSRLNSAQQAIERDYWKLREVETRCRLLFDRANEGVLMVRAADLEVVEANPAATRALDLAPSGSRSRRTLLDEVAPEEHSALTAMLHRVRDQGSAPGVLVHAGASRRPLLVRASVLPSQQGLSYLVQLQPTTPLPGEDAAGVPFERLSEASPDAFVVLETGGRIRWANAAFLQLAQVPDAASISGDPLERWLGRPGAELPVLLAELERQGSVRLFSSTLHGGLGASTEVEVAAVRLGEEAPGWIGLWIRDVDSRLRPGSAPGHASAPPLGVLDERIGATPLPQLVREAVELVERHYVNAALERTGGNRTAAAQLLGVSRQSLYAKLNRYGPDEAPGNRGPAS